MVAVSSVIYDGASMTYEWTFHLMVRSFVIISRIIENGEQKEKE